MNSKPSKPLFVVVIEEGTESDLERVKQILHQDRYTVKEVASVMGCHEKTVRDWLKQGKLEYFRPTPHKTYVTRDQLAEFMSRRKIFLHLKGS
jgi:excisionase family DNA binding protein